MKRITFSLKKIKALEKMMELASWDAAEALGSMISQKVEVKFSGVDFLSFKRIFEAIGSETERIGVVFMMVSGDVEGALVFVFKDEALKKLLRVLLGRESSPENMGELEISALKSVGNIVGTSFLNALSKITSLSLLPSIPAFTYDFAGAALDAILINQTSVASQVLYLQVNFSVEGVTVPSSLFFFPAPSGLSKLLERI